MSKYKRSKEKMVPLELDDGRMVQTTESGAFLYLLKKALREENEQLMQRNRENIAAQERQRQKRYNTPLKLIFVWSGILWLAGLFMGYGEDKPISFVGSIVLFVTWIVGLWGIFWVISRPSGSASS